MYVKCNNLKMFHSLFGLKCVESLHFSTSMFMREIKCLLTFEFVAVNVWTSALCHSYI